MKIKLYQRTEAVLYARRWALGRNPEYYSFDGIGGDCTNFISQCIYAGSGIMNDTPIFGWYYYDSENRTASWTGVEYLKRFLIENQGIGPFGHLSDADEMIPGDIIQLGDGNGRFYHSLLVVDRYPEILVAAHSEDVLNKPLSSYQWEQIRYIHIDGVRIN